MHGFISLLVSLTCLFFLSSWLGHSVGCSSFFPRALVSRLSTSFVLSSPALLALDAPGGSLGCTYWIINYFWAILLVVSPSRLLGVIWRRVGAGSFSLLASSLSSPIFSFTFFFVVFNAPLSSQICLFLCVHLFQHGSGRLPTRFGPSLPFCVLVCEFFTILTRPFPRFFALTGLRPTRCLHYP